MATRVIIHIGLHKTGTSAIQEFCAQNRNQLLDQAIDYTEIGLHETGHHILSHKWPGWLDESSFSEASDSAWDRLADYARADDGKTVLISSENFCGLGNKKYFEESLSFIRDKLSEAKVEIIAYVRRQDDFAESLFKQGVRGQDFCYSIDEFIGDLPAIFDYFETFSIWAKYFGKENVSVRFFEPEHFLGGDLIADFFERSGLRVPENSNRSGVKKNPSLSSAAAIFLTDPELAQFFHDDRFRKAIVRGIGPIGFDRPSQERILSLDQRRQVMEQFSSSNLALQQAFMTDYAGQELFRPESIDRGCFDRRIRNFNYYQLRKVLQIIMSDDSG